MRILQLRFQNLNSLVGEWHIDLTQPAYVSDGIFAITGPTGAGKTTILDALCLALYGRTPRLSKVTKSENEIMSRQTGTCFAEVTFETQKGRFRCHWSQHRSRKRADGELQAPKHELANADSGAILQAKLKDVAEEVASVTGMDFSQFTRSILLAQGGFAAFLQAAPDERAPLLEQITGAEIYSALSKRVHELHRAERDKLERLQLEAAGIVILEEEEELALQQRLEIQRHEEADITLQAVGTDKALTWLRAIAGLHKELASLEKEAATLQRADEAFQAERDRLNLAERASSLDGPYATLLEIRKLQTADQRALKTGEKKQLDLEYAVKDQSEALEEAEGKTTKAKEEIKAAMPRMQETRILDQQIAVRNKAVLEVEERCDKEAARLAGETKARDKEQKKRAEAQHALSRTLGYLKEHAQDALLGSELAGVEEQLAGLLVRHKEIAQQENAQAKAAKALAQAAKRHEEQRTQAGIGRQELESAVTQLQQGQEALTQLLGERLLREYRADHVALLRERIFLEKIADLESLRAELEDGKACPLCGAKEHPYAQGNIPHLDETEKKIAKLEALIHKAEKQEAANIKRADKQAAARQSLAEAEKQEIAAARDHEAAEKSLAELKAGLAKLHATFAQLEQTLAAKLQPLGIKDVHGADVAALRKQLHARRDAWQAQEKQKNSAEKLLADCDSEIKRQDALIATYAASLAENRERLERVHQELSADQGKRKAVYGSKDPDVEDKRLNKAVTDAEKGEKKARELHSELSQEWNTVKSQVAALLERIAQRKADLESKESAFSLELEARAFADEELFLAARISAEQKAALSAKAAKLEHDKTALQARQEDRQRRLAEERDKRLSEQTLEELEVQKEACEARLKDLRDSIAASQHRLHENAAAKERIQEKQTALEAQRKECARWDKLHSLIGSADGKKYRNFVQELTFEIMVVHANRQLRRMTERYVLSRDDKASLEFKVIDNYQAGEQRSTKNLSGGESFLVSLALALGLSQMSSRKVRVDSLFLDEGFGTLDEEALETALETLASLQRDGKLIGVISHVPTLRERISTQIQVTPQSGGRSHLAGPGCSRVSSSS